MNDLREITNLVKRDIRGRIANTHNYKRMDSIEVLMEYVLKAGGGNHLEIGTLFGGSAIAVALAKVRNNQSGVVVCVDPLDGFYMDNEDMKEYKDPLTGLPITPDSLFANIDTFGVGNKIMVMKSRSDAVANLIGMQFTTAYIDGDHWGNVPANDWNMVKDLVSHYVIFDNWDDRYPDVERACILANMELGWTCVYKQGISYVVERIAEAPLATLDAMEHNGRHTE